MQKVIVKISWSPPYSFLPLSRSKLQDPSKATVVVKVLWNNFEGVHCVVTSCSCSFCEINCTDTWVGKDRGHNVKRTSSACGDDYKEANKSGFCSQVCPPISVETCSCTSGQDNKKNSHPFPKDPIHLCAENQHNYSVLLMPILDGLANQWSHASCLQRDAHHAWKVHLIGNLPTWNCRFNDSGQFYKVNCNYFYMFYMWKV